VVLPTPPFWLAKTITFILFFAYLYFVIYVFAESTEARKLIYILLFVLSCFLIHKTNFLGAEATAVGPIQPRAEEVTDPKNVPPQSRHVDLAPPEEIV
jgi:hypothetical protein